MPSSVFPICPKIGLLAHRSGGQAGRPILFFLTTFLPWLWPIPFLNAGIGSLNKSRLERTSFYPHFSGYVDALWSSPNPVHEVSSSPKLFSFLRDYLCCNFFFFPSLRRQVVSLHVFGFLLPVYYLPFPEARFPLARLSGFHCHLQGRPMAPRKCWYSIRFAAPDHVKQLPSPPPPSTSQFVLLSSPLAWKPPSSFSAFSSLNRLHPSFFQINYLASPVPVMEQTPPMMSGQCAAVLRYAFR